MSATGIEPEVQVEEEDYEETPESPKGKGRRKRYLAVVPSAELKEYLLRNKISVHEFAHACGWHDATVNNWIYKTLKMPVVARRMIELFKRRRGETGSSAGSLYITRIPEEKLAWVQAGLQSMGIDLVKLPD